MKKLKMIIAVLVISLVLVGTGGAYFYMNSKTTVSAATTKSKPETVVEVTEKDGLTMNLKGRGYIKVNMSVGLTNEKMAEELTTKKAVILDKVIDVFSKEDLATASNISAIQEKLTVEISDLVPEAGITKIYFTQYVMQ